MEKTSSCVLNWLIAGLIGIVIRLYGNIHDPYGIIALWVLVALDGIASIALVKHIIGNNKMGIVEKIMVTDGHVVLPYWFVASGMASLYNIGDW